MTVSLSLVQAAPNRLRNLATHDGSAGDAATLSYATMAGDAAPGQLKELIDALSGVVTSQAEARRALADGAASSPAIADVLRARMAVTPRDTGSHFVVDADTDGSDNPEVNVTAGTTAAANAYVDIELLTSPDA